MPHLRRSFITPMVGYTLPKARAKGEPPRQPHYILRLIGQVITVSLETQSITTALPSFNLG